MSDLSDLLLSSLEQSTDGYCLIDAEHQVLFVNRAWLLLLSAEQLADHFRGQPWKEFFPDHLSDSKIAPLLETIEEDGSAETRFQFNTATDTLTLSLRGSAFHSPQAHSKGTLLHLKHEKIRSIGLDESAVIRRKEIQEVVEQERLRANEERLRIIIEQLPAIVWTVDKNLVFTSSEGAALESIGKSPGELLGKTLYEFFDTNDPNFEPILYHQRALQGKEVLYELEWMNRIFQVHLDALHNPQGEITGCVGVALDITDRKQVEQALRTSEERFRQLAENIQEIFYLLKVDPYHVIYLSPAYEKISGRTCQSVYENPWGWADMIHPEDRDRVRKHSEKCLTSQTGNQIEYRIQHLDGTIRWLHDRNFPIFDNDGNIIRIAGSAKDVTERKLAQQTLSEHQRLEKQRVEEELIRVQGELVRSTRLAALGQIAAQIAHDLRNPLGVVRNSVFLLKRQLPNSEKKWHEYLEYIENEVITSDRIIRNLLEVTRGKEVFREMVDLPYLLAERASRFEIPDGIQVQIECTPKAYLLSVDATQFAQVVDNLIKNALDAVISTVTSTGTSPNTISITANRTDDFDVILFSDTGMGIPEEQRAMVFELLFTTKAKGTGLGLTICRQIIERHGGTITLLENQSSGAQFEIKLPRQEVS